MSPDQEKLIFNAKILVSRLERLSADSHWAHRASGLRGSLLRTLKRAEKSLDPDSFELLENLIPQGQDILTNAAKEIPDIDAIIGKGEIP